MSRFDEFCEEYATRRMREEYPEGTSDDDAYDAFLYEAGTMYCEDYTEDDDDPNEHHIRVPEPETDA